MIGGTVGFAAFGLFSLIVFAFVFVEFRNEIRRIRRFEFESGYHEGYSDGTAKRAPKDFP